MSTWTLEELYHAQEELHIELSYELQLAGKELEYAMFIAAVCFMLPIALLNKYIYTRLTERRFILTTPNMIDLTIFGLVVWWYELFAVYSSYSLDFPLFGPEEDG